MNGRSLAAGSIRTETPGQAMQLAGRPVVDTSARDAGQTGASMHATAVELWLDRIAMAPPAEALNQARALWASLLDAGTYPTLAQTAELLADFQFMAIRDRLIADIPGMDEPIHGSCWGKRSRRRVGPGWSGPNRSCCTSIRTEHRSMLPRSCWPWAISAGGRGGAARPSNSWNWLWTPTPATNWRCW